MVRCVTMLALLAWSFLWWPGQSAARQPDELGKFDVGHTTFRMDLIGAVGEARPVDVEVWYPARKENFESTPLAIYRSRFHGVTLIPSKWDPLSWELASRVAREGAPIDGSGKAFPVLVFSHGSTSSPLDFVKNHEHLASHGYVVAVPWHTRHNQDDVRANFVNVQNGGPRFMPFLASRMSSRISPSTAFATSEASSTRCPCSSGPALTWIGSASWDIPPGQLPQSWRPAAAPRLG
jgi:hypothetical protein